MKSDAGGKFAAAVLDWTMLNISLGPIPLWNKILGVPYDPAI